MDPSLGLADKIHLKDKVRYMREDTISISITAGEKTAAETRWSESGISVEVDWRCWRRSSEEGEEGNRWRIEGRLEIFFRKYSKIQHIANCRRGNVLLSEKRIEKGRRRIGKRRRKMAERRMKRRRRKRLVAIL